MTRGRRYPGRSLRQNIHEATYAGMRRCVGKSPSLSPSRPRHSCARRLTQRRPTLGHRIRGGGVTRPKKHWPMVEASRDEASLPCVFTRRY